MTDMTEQENLNILKNDYRMKEHEFCNQKLNKLIKSRIEKVRHRKSIEKFLMGIGYTHDEAKASARYLQHVL